MEVIEVGFPEVLVSTNGYCSPTYLSPLCLVLSSSLLPSMRSSFLPCSSLHRSIFFAARSILCPLSPPSSRTLFPHFHITGAVSPFRSISWAIWNRQVRPIASFDRNGNFLFYTFYMLLRDDVVRCNSAPPPSFPKRTNTVARQDITVTDHDRR